MQTFAQFCESADGPFNYVGYESHFDRMYPKIGKKESVDGRTIRHHIPNEESIHSSVDNHQILPGIRDVSMALFSHSPYSSAGDEERVNHLAKAIHHSKEINPLIVVHDSEGPYVLEGGHRINAFHREVCRLAGSASPGDNGTASAEPQRVLKQFRELVSFI